MRDSTGELTPARLAQTLRRDGDLESVDETARMEIAVRGSHRKIFWLAVFRVNNFRGEIVPISSLGRSGPEPTFLRVDVIRARRARPDRGVLLGRN